MLVKQYYDRINHFLETRLPTESSKPEKLHQAMRYAVLNGGKRIRALLTYLSGELLKADLDVLDNAAAAIELIHAFSLIHDDLPALDNDDLRRGKPATSRFAQPAWLPELYQKIRVALNHFPLVAERTRRRLPKGSWSRPLEDET